MNRKTKPLPSQDRLRELLDYDPETGVLTWRWRPMASGSWNKRWAGHQAFSQMEEQGYLVGKLDGKSYRAHRIIYKMVHDSEPDEIDHEDHDRANNRILNLSPAVHKINGRNQKRSIRNVSGITGVNFHKKTQKWVASIRVDNEKIHLGLFATKEAAAVVRLAKQQELGFHERHGT